MVIQGRAGRERSGPNTAVLGLGLIGGSLALALRERGYDVIGQDTDPQTLAAAQTCGLTVASSVAEAVRGADLVVLAVPLVAMAQVAAQVATHLDLSDDATVMDVGSVKRAVRAVLVAAGLGERFVGAHPMAGNEHAGFSAASAALLLGAPWAVTTTGSVAEHRVNLVRSLIIDGLDGRITELSDGEHDAAVALVSHLPHVLATELLNQVAHAPNLDVALSLSAGSFRDVSRVGYTNPDRTSAMLRYNALALAPLVRRAATDLTGLADALDALAASQVVVPTGDDAVTAFCHEADRLRQVRLGQT